MANLEDTGAEISSFSRLYPPYREKYLQESWPIVEFALSDFGVYCKLNLEERCMTVSTTMTKTKTRDPYYILDKATELLRLLARSVPAPQALKILKDDMYCEIIDMRVLARKKKSYLRRRQRLLGPNSSILKKLESETGRYILAQGRTVAAMGSVKGVYQVECTVEKCMMDIPRPQRLSPMQIFKLAKRLEEDRKEREWQKFLNSEAFIFNFRLHFNSGLPNPT